MSYSKFFQGIMLGLTAFSLFLNFEFLEKKSETKESVSESWNNVGKYLSKAINDYKKTIGD